MQHGQWRFPMAGALFATGAVKEDALLYPEKFNFLRMIIIILPVRISNKMHLDTLSATCICADPNRSRDKRQWPACRIDRGRAERDNRRQLPR